MYSCGSSHSNSVISTLEKLKTEAAEISRKVEETDIIMKEVETVSQQYMPLSLSCSSIYFTMESINQVRRRCSLLFFFFMTPDKCVTLSSRCIFCINTRCSFSSTSSTPFFTTTSVSPVSPTTRHGCPSSHPTCSRSPRCSCIFLFQCSFCGTYLRNFFSLFVSGCVQSSGSWNATSGQAVSRSSLLPHSSQGHSKVTYC